MSGPTCQRRYVFIGEAYFRFVLHRTPIALHAVHNLKTAAAKFHSKTHAFFPRRSCVAAVMAIVAAFWCGYARSAPFPQLVTPNWAQLAAYWNVKSYVDRSTAELIATIPDLKGLHPVTNKQQGEKFLNTILGRVGNNVRQFFAEFPDITSHEHITMERLGPGGRIEFWRDETFRYLAVARPGQAVSTLEEYRTDKSGKPVQPTGLTQGFVVTKGFASAAIYLHPALQPDSSFRYLGKQKLDRRDTDVIAFAQRPAWAGLPIEVSIGGRTASLLVQGLLWIDPANYQIVRMRTDLLAPCPYLGLMGATTVITFRRVRFQEMPETVLWLPRKVTVTTKWEGNGYTERTSALYGTNGLTTVIARHRQQLTFRNIHRYSHYRLFGSKSKLKY